MTTRDRPAEPEQRIVAAAGTGETVDLRVGDTEADDPVRGDTWPDSRTVRAELLVELLTAGGALTTGPVLAVRVRGARIVGSLDLEARSLSCPLLLDGCSIAEAIVLDEARAPSVRLPGCHIRGLSATQLRTTGNLELNDGFTAVGEVNLLGARIGGQLLFGGASLRNPGGIALNGDGLTVEQNMLCVPGFAADGEVRLPRARISGQLVLSGATLRNPGDVALNGDGLTVERDMFCRAGFTADGEVLLRTARIGGQLSFDEASLHNPGGQVLAADRLTVEQEMFCDDGFATEGEVRLAGARIGGHLSFDGASLRNADGLALLLHSLVAAVLILLPVRRPEGGVDLTNARVGAFYDEQETWPTELWLGGFVYESLENDQIRVRDRLNWLRRHAGGYAPGIYDQLTAAYQRRGYTEAARRVGVAKQWRRRSVISPVNWLLYLAIGYGYRTWLAVVWLAALATLGTNVYTDAESHHLMRPGSNAPPFHPAAYALDVLIPIADLGQRKSWTPHGTALYWTWFFTAVGWVLTTAAVAGLTGVFKRD